MQRTLEYCQHEYIVQGRTFCAVNACSECPFTEGHKPDCKYYDER